MFEFSSSFTLNLEHPATEPCLCCVSRFGVLVSSQTDGALSPIGPVLTSRPVLRSQKPYACQIPGCAKRYTDPSSLRKHVKSHSAKVAQERDVKVRAAIMFPASSREPTVTRVSQAPDASLFFFGLYSHSYGTSW